MLVLLLGMMDNSFDKDSYSAMPSKRTDPCNRQKGPGKIPICTLAQHIPFEKAVELQVESADLILVTCTAGTA